jgi:hypothetical protein
MKLVGLVWHRTASNRSFVILCGGVTKSLVQNVQCPVKALESINHFVLADNQRRSTVDVRVSVDTNKSIIIVRFLVLMESFMSGLVLELRIGSVGLVDVEASE